MKRFGGGSHDRLAGTGRRQSVSDDPQQSNQRQHQRPRQQRRRQGGFQRDALATAGTFPVGRDPPPQFCTRVDDCEDRHQRYRDQFWTIEQTFQQAASQKNQIVGMDDRTEDLPGHD